MHKIRASAIAEFEYCSLKWYFNVTGVKISKEQEIARTSAFQRGEQQHKATGIKIVKTRIFTRVLKYIIISLIILLLVLLWYTNLVTYLL